MRPADRHGTRRWPLLPAAVPVLVLSGLTAGCSRTRAFCTAGSQLKTSIHDLGNVNVVKNGLGSLRTALSKVQADAKTFATDAKSAFPSQTTALNNSLSSLATAIKSAQGQPPLTAAATVVSSVAQVKNSASALQSAISGKCQ
jgi:hypothetical protein